MSGVTFTRKVKYERELQRDITAEVLATPGGEKILTCLQCGTCGSACPLSVYMDHTPRRLIGMLREGFRQEVVESFAIWLCASCYECTVRCPAGIKVTDVMYALKRTAIHEGIYPRRFPIPVLAKEFMEMLKGNGRTNEFWLVLRVLLKTAPMKLMTSWPLGLRLWQRGRMRVTGGAIPKQGGAEVRRMLDAMQDGSNGHGKPSVAQSEMAKGAMGGSRP
ncbi:MAG TPA: 4Fe-4S dicluster domain-containing protein [Terriglobia bacterium]|nr:4Fe-4S dicluster domain-containing protein [Terriglobia bacterium]